MKSAARAVISTFGGYVGLMGMEHGIGEILQGSKAPDGLMILSWPDSAFFHILSGEPAMTILPNLLITGILAVLISLTFGVWSVLLVQRRYSSRILLLLSILMLLFGGGIFPPVLGSLLCAAAARINAPLNGWQKHVSSGTRQFMSQIWPWAFGASLLAWLGMFPGVPVLNYFFGIDSETLIYTILAAMFGFLFLATITAFVRDLPARSCFPQPS